VEGLTKQELAAQIKKRLTEPVELLKDPTVVIRLLNYKITVIGQVGREGPVSYRRTPYHIGGNWFGRRHLMILA